MSIKNKKITAIISALGTVVCAGFIIGIGGWFGGGASIPADTMTRGLAGYWSFGEGFGDTAYDASGNGNNGSLGAGVAAKKPSWSSGKVGGALSFDGVDDYVNVADNSVLSFGTSPMSVSYWAKTSALQSAGAKTLVFGKLLNSGSFDGYYGGLNTSGYAIFSWRTGATDYVATGNVNLADGKWHHYANIRNSTGVYVYVDSVLVGSNTNAAVQNNVDNNQGLAIGDGRTGSPTAEQWTGLIDEVRIYNRALSAEEIRYHYNRGGPVAQWKFDEGSGTTAYDETENNNNGTLTNFSSTDTGTATSGGNNTLTQTGKTWATNQWANGTINITGGTGSGQTRTILSNTADTITVTSNWTINPDATSTYSLAQAPAWATGKYGSALSFDGVNDYVNVANSASLNITDAITLEAWIKADSFPSYASLIRKGNDYYIGMQGSSFVTTINADWDHRILSSTKNMNTWYHVVVSYDRIKLKIYVNGIEEVSFGRTDAININSSILDIGGYSYSQPFDGLIDDVRIYNYARTADEIRLDYNAGFAAKVGGTWDFDQGQVGYWSFDQGTGSSVPDLSGNGNNGTWSGTGSHWTTGKVGGAGQFNGVNDYVDCGNNVPIGLNSFTFEFWAKTSRNSVPQVVIKRSAAITGWMGIFDFPASSTRNALFNVTDGNYSGGDIYRYVSPVDNNSNTTDGKWHHFVGVCDRSKHVKPDVYLDGLLKNDVAAGTGYCDQLTDNIPLGTLTIGGVAGAYFQGLIDEVRIYNRALSAEEIRYHYNRGGPVAQWKFDEGSGTTAYDETENNNNGTLSGFASPPTSTSGWATGKYGSALAFDGDNDYVSIPNNEVTKFGTGDFTLSAWIKVNVLDTTNRIIGGATNGVSFYVRNLNPLAFEEEGVLGTVESVDKITSTSVWYMVTVARSSGNISFYINGANAGGGGSFSRNFTGDIDYVGRCGTPYFNGLIDDVRIYNYARTADEILQDYNEGMALRFGEEGNLASLMTKGLAGYWGMGEGAGQYAYDGSGNNNTGTLGTGATPDASDPTWSTGKSGGGLSFDGVDDYVKAGDTNLPTGANPRTVAFWTKRASVANFNVGPYPFFYGTKSQYQGFGLYGVDGTTKIYFYGHTYDCDTGINLNDTNWHHLVLTFDGTNLRAYKDGALISTTNRSLLNTVLSDFDFTIGGIYAVNQYWDGLIDEVRVYNRALSAEEIRYHYNRGRPVAQWRFDEGSGQIAFDESDNNNDGYLGGTSAVETSDPTWTSGQYNTALSFDGDNDYVVKSSKTISSGNFSFAFWFKTTDTDALLIGEQSTLTTIGFIIYGASDLRFSTNSFATASYSTKNISDNMWHFAVGIYDGTNQKLYVDGVLQDSDAVTPTYTATQFIIGYNTYQGGTSYFNGLIDDVRIYNYARSAEEILIDYNQGLSTHFK